MALSLPDLIRVTTQSLLSNPLRSGLTTLGVFMGVAAVNATLQVGNISNAITRQKLAERESPRVEVGVSVEQGPELTVGDLETLRQRLRGWEYISATEWAGTPEIVFRGQAQEATVQAVTDDYLPTSGRRMVAGRFISPSDSQRFRAVIVLDELLAQQLFAGQPAVGKRVVVYGNLYQVVGVMENKLFASDWMNSRGFATIPLSTLSAMTGWAGIGQILIRVSQLEEVETVQAQAERLLLQQFPGAEIYARNNVDEILQQKQIWDLAARGLTAVGLISLLISGVGIANITIAAVIERTSEIGLRRAIGATRSEVLSQFILEAVILSLAGGLGAIATVHGLTSLVSKSFDLPYQFETRTAAFSLGSAVLVGVGACFVPALRASRLDPVKALREA